MPNRMVALGAVDQLRHDAVMQRRRIEIDRHAGQQRHHQPARQAEGVEHRQHVEHLVAGSWHRRAPAPARHWRGCCDGTARRPSGAPSEPDVNRIDRRIVRAARNARRGAGEQAARPCRARPMPARTSSGRRSLASSGDARQRACRACAFSMNARRGQHGLDLRGLQRRQHVGGAGGEIEHRRHAADALKRHERDGDAGRVRQHDADILADRRAVLELARPAPGRRGSACDRSAWCRARPR